MPKTQEVSIDEQVKALIWFARTIPCEMPPYLDHVLKAAEILAENGEPSKLGMAIGLIGTFHSFVYAPRSRDAIAIALDNCPHFQAMIQASITSYKTASN